MKADAWMPLYVAELLADTQDLTMAEFGAYVRLLCHYWRMKGPLPDDLARLRTVTGDTHSVTQCVTQSDTHTVTHPSLTAAMLRKFFTLENGFWHQKRCDVELARSARLYDAKCRAAKTCNAKRTAKPTDAATHSVTQCVTHSVTHTTATASDNNNNNNESISTELPLNFPTTAEIAKNTCACLNIDPAFVVECWDQAVARGGRDWNDVPVRNFAGYVKACKNYADSRQAEKAESASRQASGNGQRQQPTVWQLREQIKALDEEITQHKDRNGFTDAMGWKPRNEEARTKLRELVQRRKALNAQLASLNT